MRQNTIGSKHQKRLDLLKLQKGKTEGSGALRYRLYKILRERNPAKYQNYSSYTTNFKLLKQYVKSKAAEQGSTLIGRFLKSKTLPGRREILEAAGNLGKKLKQNPIGAIKQGIQQDRAARQALKAATGMGRKEVAGKVLSAAKEPIKDMAVNVGGLAGSVVGGSAGGTVGALAGDLAGAGLARKGIDDAAATLKAIKETKGKGVQRVKDVLSKAKENVKAAKGTNIPEYQKDVIGWGVGNTAAAAIPVGIPFKGAAVAIPTVTPIHEGFKRGSQLLKQGATPKEALKGGVAKTKHLLKRGIIGSGNIKEKWVRRKINRNLKQTLPDIPPNLVFRSPASLTLFYSRSNRLSKLKQ